MPEISSQDLRRLRALEGRLAKARDDARAISLERRELRERTREAERAAKAAERQASDTEERVAALVAENARMSARLETIEADSERLRSAAMELRQQLDEARDTAKNAQSEEKRLTKALKDAEAERDRLDERVKLAEAQLKTETTTPVLPAKEVASLIDNFVSELGTGLPGLAVRDGEVRLQVAFAKVGRQTGFVVPSADAPPELAQKLHEVAVRFDRTGKAMEPPDR